MKVWRSVWLGLARFGVLRLAPDVQIQIAIGLGLALGLARFALVWLGVARCMEATKSLVKWSSVWPVGGRLLLENRFGIQNQNL